MAKKTATAGEPSRVERAMDLLRKLKVKDLIVVNTRLREIVNNGS